MLGVSYSAFSRARVFVSVLPVGRVKIIIAHTIHCSRAELDVHAAQRQTSRRHVPVQAFACKARVCLTDIHVDFLVNGRDCIGRYHHRCSGVVLSVHFVDWSSLPSKIQGRHLKLPALGAETRDGAQRNGSLLDLQETAA